jgi:hypothetical protein
MIEVKRGCFTSAIVDVPMAGQNPVVFDPSEPEVCTWTQDKDRNYSTYCGNGFYFGIVLDTVTDCGFVYCPFCGKPIKDIPYGG